MRQQTHDLDPRHAGDLGGELGGWGSRRAAHPVQPDVDLHQHLERRAAFGPDPPHPLRDVDRVERDSDRRAFEEGAQPSQLRLAEDRKGDQDVVDPRVDHDLGLAELRHGDPTRPRGQLHARDLDRLVSLRVRPQPHAGRRRHGPHLGDVPPHEVEVPQQRRRVEVEDAGHGPGVRRRGRVSRRAPRSAGRRSPTPPCPLRGCGPRIRGPGTSSRRARSDCRCGR